MAEAIVDRFIAALKRLEDDREFSSIVSCFSEQAEMGGAAAPKDTRGGVESYWRLYRDAFKELQSSFRNVITNENTAALEWTTQGTNRFGEPIRYSGVSVLEHDGERITRFYAYFDPTVLAHRQQAERIDPVIFHRESEDLIREIP